MPEELIVLKQSGTNLKHSQPFDMAIVVQDKVSRGGDCSELVSDFL
jgi:hypothetical protein